MFREMQMEKARMPGLYSIVQRIPSVAQMGGLIASLFLLHSAEQYIKSGSCSGRNQLGLAQAHGLCIRYRH